MSLRAQGAARPGGITGWGKRDGLRRSSQKALEPRSGTREWYTGQEVDFGWLDGVVCHGGTHARDRSEWVRSTDMETTMWVTRRADGLKPLFSSGNGASTFTAMHFDLDKRAVESVTNFVDVHLLTTTYKEVGRRRG